MQRIYLVVLLHTFPSHSTTDAKLRLLPEKEALDAPQIRSRRQWKTLTRRPLATFGQSRSQNDGNAQNAIVMGGDGVPIHVLGETHSSQMRLEDLGRSIVDELLRIWVGFGIMKENHFPLAGHAIAIA